MTPKKGDQISMFPKEYRELRLCLGCRTKYEEDPDLHDGGWCPTCGSQRYEMAIKSDYHMPPEPEPEHEDEGTPEPGSTEDYKNG